MESATVNSSRSRRGRCGSPTWDISTLRCCKGSLTRRRFLTRLSYHTKIHIASEPHDVIARLNAQSRTVVDTWFETGAQAHVRFRLIAWRVPEVIANRRRQKRIEKLIRAAKHFQAAKNRGEVLGLSKDEISFYDALAAHESAVEGMGLDEFKVIAAEMLNRVRARVTIDWTFRDNARAAIRVLVRGILKKYGYPPDLQAEATKLVLE